MSQRPFTPYPKPVKQPKKPKIKLSWNDRKLKKGLHDFAVTLSKIKPRKRIRRVSAKRKDKLREYTPLRKKYLLSHPNCEIKLIGCEGKAVEIHHCSTSDKDFLNTSTWKGACRHCHDRTERILSASERRKLGLLK